MAIDLSRLVGEFISARRTRPRRGAGLRSIARQNSVRRPAPAMIRPAYEVLEDRMLLSVSATLGWTLAVDANSDGKVNPGDTLQYTAAVSATGAVATSVGISIPLDPNTSLVNGSVHVSPLAFDDSYNWTGNTLLDSAADGLPSLFANDVTLNATGGTDTVTLSSSTTVTSIHGGAVTINASTGAFTYLPAVGYTGPDSFTYTLANSAAPTLTDTATANISLSGRVWFVQNATVNGNGESNSPFNTLLAATTAATNATDSIYVLQDVGANAKLNGNVALKASQQLLGAGVPLTVSGVTAIAAGTSPTITNTAGDVVSLATGNTIAGITIGNHAGIAIKGTTVGSLTVNTTTINGTGGGILVNGGALNVTLAGLTVTSGANAVNLNGVTGTFTVSGGAISGTSGVPFLMSASSANVNFAATVTNSSSANSIFLQSETGGTVNFTASITDTGGGVFLSSNANTTINFSGGLNLSTGTNTAFTATNNGSLSVTGSSNTLATTFGTALNLVNTTLLAAGMTFQSISAGTNVGGPTNGILVNNTGTSGSLTVTGTGSTRSSGGTIQHTSADALSLTSTLNPSFTDLRIDNPFGSGISGGSLNGLTLNHVDIVKPGGNVANGPDGISFDTNVSGSEQNLIGTVTVSDTTISQHNNNAISILNNGGTLNMTVNNGSVFTGRGTSDLNGGNGILAIAMGTATINLSVVKGTAADMIQNERLSAVNLFSEGTNSFANLKIDQGIFQNNNGASGTIALSALGTNHATFNITSNQLLANLSDNIVIFAGDSSTITGFVSTNTINGNPGNLAVNPDQGRGIVLLGDGSSAATAATFTLTTQVNNNTISNSGGDGIFIRGRQTSSHSGVVNTTLTSNTINAPGSTFLNNGIQVQARDAATVNTALTGNNSTGSVGGPGYRFFENSTAINNVYKGISSSSVLGTVLTDNSNVGGLPQLTTSGTITINGTAPALPPVPILLKVGNTVKAKPTSVVKTVATVAKTTKVVKPVVKTIVKSPTASLSTTLTTNIATLPAGKTVTMLFRATVNNPLPAGVQSVSVQGTVVSTTAGVTTPVLTDDTSVPGPTNPTVTPIVTTRDLSVTIDDGGVTATPGSTITYTIGYGSTGNIGSAGVKLTETLPANTTFNAGGSTVGWTLVGGVYQLTIGTLAAGASGSAKFVVTVNASLPPGTTSVSATATVADDGASGVDSNLPNNSATKVTAVSVHPDLTVSVDDGGLTPTPGQTLKYNVAYSNTGSSGSTGVVLTETVPANTTFNSVQSSAGWTVSAGVYHLTVGALAGNGASGSVVFAVTVNSPLAAGIHSLSDTASIADDGTNGTDSNPANNTFTKTTNLVTSPDLSVSINDGGAHPAPGANLVYTVGFANNGNIGAAGVALTETVPANATFNSAASTPGWALVSGSVYKFVVGAVAAGGSGTELFAVTVNNPLAAGALALSDTATVADDGANGTDSNIANNTTTILTTTSAHPDLAVTLSDGGVVAQPGGLVTYTIGYSNTGNIGTTGVKLTETLPANTTFNAGGSTAGWTLVAGSYQLALGALAAGASGSAKFVVNVNSPLPPGTTSLSATAGIADDGTNGTDSNTGNNSANKTTPILVNPDLAVTINDGGTIPAPGATQTYIVGYSNAGGAATGVVLTETVPANATFNAAASSPTWTFVSGSTYHFPVGSLATLGSGTATFAVTVNTPLPAGTVSLSDTASVADDATHGADANSANNTVTVLTAIAAHPNLGVTLSDGGVVAKPGAAVTYTIGYTNTGNIGSTGVTLTETLPANTTFDTVLSTPGWTLVGGNYKLTIGGVAVGTVGSAKFIVDVNTPFPSGVSTLSDTASIADDSANGTDSNPANNSDTVATTVAATITGVAASWGIAGSMTLQTAADGLRLLQPGRSTDVSALGIKQIQITLSHATTLSPGDVSVTGINVANYGPVTVSGGGTSYTLTLAQPINAADRVTVTIGNAIISTYTRRIDVLPGDFNDDGVVNSQDMIGVRNQFTGFGGAPTIFGDVNGDGSVDINDYNIVRQRIGSILP